MRTVEVHDAKLVVTPDNSTPGSEGRLYLQLPDALKSFVGKTFKAVGNFGQHDAIILVATISGHAITPKLQFWWKNGVRDHNIRENHRVRVWLLTESLWTIQLIEPTGEAPPVLPPHQDLLFDEA